MLAEKKGCLLARKLDWDYTMCERRILPTGDQRNTPASPYGMERLRRVRLYKTSYREYGRQPIEKDMAVMRCPTLPSPLENIQNLAAPGEQSERWPCGRHCRWRSSLAHRSLRGARFGGREQRLANHVTFGALGSYRPTQIPLLLFIILFALDSQFDGRQVFTTPIIVRDRLPPFFDELERWDKRD